MPVINRISEFHNDMITWRRHLHANPELGFDTFETSAFVADRLREFGVDEIVTGIGKTGVVGVIKGNGDGPTIGLRADMDALPIQEARDIPHKSLVAGKMHACGHDGHTTMLLGAARYLAETRNFSGSVAVVFQPAEEGGGGGEVMVQDGLMRRFDISQIYALHNWPGIEAGQFQTRPGAIMAATDTFDIHITGRGAHAAMPHQSVDPVLTASAITQNLQSIVARGVDPSTPLVISVTQIHTGDVSNVIPETAYINGTVRTLEAGLNDWVTGEMERVISHTAAAYGATAKLNYEKGYPVTVNHPDATAFAVAVAGEISGAANVNDTAKASLGAEDFAYMLEECKGAYVFLGQGDTAGLHHPEYDFNDEISPIGASFFVRLVETAQPVGPAS